MVNSALFERNLKRWGRFCPEAAETLPSVDASFVTMTDGFMRVSDNGEEFFCEDPDDPLKEAQEAIDSAGLEGANVVLAYGVGAGRMHDALKDWLSVSPARQLVFLEPDLRVIKRLLETEKGEELLRDPQVWLYHLDPEGKALDKVTDLFAMQPSRFIVLKRYMDKTPQKIQQIHSTFAFLESLKQTLLHEYMNYGWGYFQNFFHNMLKLPDARPSSQLYGRFANVPAIICGAGPSLKKNLHLLEGLKDRALIFAGGTSMNAVNANGFVPHFGVGIDPNPDQFARLITNLAFETPYFYRNRLQHSSLSLLHGDHLYVQGSGGYGITQWFEERLGIDAKDVAEGCNVINFSLSIAAELGCNPIIFVGVDLAYSDEEPYAPGVINHPIHIRREHFKTKNAAEELIVKPDIYGNAVYTLWKWVMESCWFTTFAANNPHLTLINATEGGLGFSRIPNMPLSEVIGKHLGGRYDFEGLVHTEVQRSQMPPSVTKEKINALMKEFSASLDECSACIAAVQEEIKRAAVSLRQGDALPEGPLSEKAEESLRKLERQLAYVNFLNVFDETFTKSIALENTRLDIEKDALEPEKAREQKLSLLMRRYQFLATTAAVNQKHLSAALQHEEIRSEMFNALSESHRSSSQPVADNRESTDFDPSDKSLQSHSKKDASGRLVARYSTREGLLHGPFTHYYEEGSVAAFSTFDNGARVGKTTNYYPSGRLASVQPYQEGLPNGKHLYYYPDGAVKAEIDYAGGRLDGKVHLYDHFGRLCRELSFSQGKREGVERIWNEEGLLVVEVFFKEDRPSGRARRWYDNGNMSLETIYDEAGFVSQSRRWDSGGQLVEEAAPESDDYFDQVTKETGVLTRSLDNVFHQLANVIPALANSVEGQNSQLDFASLEKSIAVLRDEMDRLKAFNQQLIVESGLDPTMHKEPLWKTPTTRRLLEIEVEQKATKISKELSAIQISLAKALQDLTKPQS